MLSVNVNQILHVLENQNISYWKNSNIKTYSYEIPDMSKPVSSHFINKSWSCV